MSQHTPVPWEIYPDGDRRHVVQAGTLEFPSFSLTKANWIAELDPDGTGHDADETGANAEFIVRACNSHDALLEACKRLVAWRAGVPADGDDHGGQEALMSCVEAARTAIAGAEGGAA